MILSIGAGRDTGIDGVAIIVNGNIILEPDEIDFLEQKNGYLNVSFSFIQSKTSDSFSGAQILTFLVGIRNFFSDKTFLPENDDVVRLRSIKDKIYERSLKFSDNPSLNLFFVCAGSWKKPTHIQGLIDSELAILKDGSYFSNISFQCIDAERLKRLYREIRRRSVIEISFPSLIALPEINGVLQSFVGSISTVEYMKLITDSDGELRKNLFDDNVRDYQGNTSVNLAIDKTIKSGNQAALAIFNNGITIICRKIERTAAKVKLTDYQIVNGCQTSNVLFANKDVLVLGTHIILRMIETTDPEIAVNVIKATNRQTEVKVEAFESLSEFHKDLEEYYKAQVRKRKYPIYYERHSKQYDNDPKVRGNQVVTLSAQIKSYVSAQFAQPQSTHWYFSELLDSNRDKMFIKGEPLARYYVASSILNRLEDMFRRRLLQKAFKGFKYHLVLMIYNFLILVHSSKAGPDFEKIINAIDDDETMREIAEPGINSIVNALKRLGMSRQDGVRSREVTALIVREMESAARAR
jgi:AIPR protein